MLLALSQLHAQHSALLVTDEPWRDFFFHVTNGSTFKDAEGENCSSLEAPRTHAAEIAGELGKDRGYEGRHNRNRLYL